MTRSTTPPTRYFTPAHDPVGVVPAGASGAGGAPGGRAHARRGRPRREPAIQLGGVGVAHDVSDLIEELTEHDGTARAVIENAVRAYVQQLNQYHSDPG